jgi:hypothetical protein
MNVQTSDPNPALARDRAASLIFSFVSVHMAPGHEPEAQLHFAHPHAHDTIEFHVHLGWESRYFSEGRDSLDGGSLFVSSFEMGWEHLAGGVWYGYFAEIAASRELSMSDRFALNFSIPFGINQGYVSDGHDGANNMALRLGSEYVLSDSLSPQ